MVEEGYTNQQIQNISGACSSSIARWKRQYKAELSGHTPEKSNVLTHKQQRIQLLEKQLKKALRDNDRLRNRSLNTK